MAAKNELISAAKLKTGPDRNRREFFDLAAFLILFGWLGFNWFSTVTHVLRYYNPLPVSDYWRVIEDLPAFEAGNFSWLWRQHNEHRIMFPEIIFALDQLFFAGRQILPMVVSFCCYVASVALLGRVFWRDNDTGVPARLQTIMLAGIIAGWPLSTFVLGTPFLLNWTLLQLAVVLGLVCVSKRTGNSHVVWLMAAITCGIVATFSCANGLVLWPILLTVAAIRHAPRKCLIALAAAAVGCVALFLVGYQRPGTPPLGLLKHPIYSIGFVVSYFSMPFGVLRNPAIGFAFGLLSLTAWLVCFARTLRTRAAGMSDVKLLAFGYFAFLLLTAALTSLARLDLTDIGFSGAKAARYVTLPLLGWAVLLLLAIRISFGEKSKRFPPRVILVSTAIVVAFMQIRLGRWLRTNDDYVSHQQWAALSLENGVFDPALLGSVFPKEAFIARYLPVLRSHRKSIFSERESSFPGQQFRSLFPKPGRESERGGVIRLTPVRGGISVLGWAASLGRGGKDTVLFVDKSGMIVGFGQRLCAGTPREFMPIPVPASQTWVGFVNGQYGTTLFVPYLVDTDSAAASPIAGDTSIQAPYHN
ncbi:MAG: hypothetical protein ACJ746_07245 [Bryobacteraceae bacterium]